MGISVRAKLMYGDYYNNIIDKLSEEEIEELEEDIDNGGIDYASPFYDADRDGWFVGYELVQDFDVEGLWVFEDSLKNAEIEFLERFRKHGTVRAVKHIY